MMILANFDRTRELNIKSVGFSFKPKLHKVIGSGHSLKCA
jgi:hypothetical protein